MIDPDTGKVKWLREGLKNLPPYIPLHYGDFTRPKSPFLRRGTKGDVNRLNFQSPCIPLLQGGFCERGIPLLQGGCLPLKNTFRWGIWRKMFFEHPP